MVKGPGFYSDIGRSTRDLLNRDYNFDHKFTVSTTTLSGLAFTSTGVRKGGDLLGGDVAVQFKHHNLTADVKIDTGSNISAIISADEVAQGVKTIFSFTAPNFSSGKVETQYVHDNAAVTAAVGLTGSPIVDFTSAIGSKDYTFGGAVSVDTGSGTPRKYEAGIGITKPDFSASLILADKFDTLKASYSHLVSPLSKAAVGAEVVHSISRKENTFTIGGAYSLDMLTTVKARMNNQGKIAAVIQHEFRPKSYFTIAGEVDTIALNRNTKFGIGMSLKP